MLHTKFILGVAVASGGILAIGLIPGTTISYSSESTAPLHDTYLSVPSEDLSSPPVLTTPAVETLLEENISTDEYVVSLDESLSVQETVVLEGENERSTNTTTEEGAVREVPFYSQLTDISSPEWKKIGCGIASLAMLIEFHNPGSLESVDTLLEEGIDAGAYLTNAGWTYAGLIGVSRKYGLDGMTHDLGGTSVDAAFEEFVRALSRGPVMASVHYTFVPTNPIPHLVIVNGVDGNTLYYNDPAEPSGGGSISVAQFKSAWKKRYIEFYPTS